MGYQNGSRVHYWDAGRDRCIPMLLTDDGAPNYNDVVSGVLIEPGAANGAPAILTTRLNVEHDEQAITPKDMDTVAKVHGTWHTWQECPERFNDGNADRRKPRRGPPVIDGPVRGPRPRE